MEASITYNIISHITEDMHAPLLEMIKSSFEEHSRNGMHFTCSNYSIEDLKQKVLSGKYFVALSERGEILGITSYTATTKPATAYGCITAISKDVKRTGIGSALQAARNQSLRKDGYRHLVSDTAVGATGSVNWHLRKCGCHLIGYKSYSNTNYYSYVFVQDMSRRCMFVRRVIYPMRFWYYFLKTRICKKANGEYRAAIAMFKRICNRR